MRVRFKDGGRASAGALLGAAVAAGMLLAAEGFEPAPTVKTADAVPAALVKGAKHELAPTARGDGFLLDFSVQPSLFLT